MGREGVLQINTFPFRCREKSFAWMLLRRGWKPTVHRERKKKRNLRAEFSIPLQSRSGIQRARDQRRRRKNVPGDVEQTGRMRWDRTAQPCSPAWWQNQWASRRDPAPSSHLQRGRTGRNQHSAGTQPPKLHNKPILVPRSTLGTPRGFHKPTSTPGPIPVLRGPHEREIWIILGVTAPTGRAWLAAHPQRCQGRALTVAVEELEFVVGAVVRLLVALFLEREFGGKKKRRKKKKNPSRTYTWHI